MHFKDSNGRPANSDAVYLLLTPRLIGTGCRLRTNGPAVISRLPHSSTEVNRKRARSQVSGALDRS